MCFEIYLILYLINKFKKILYGHKLTKKHSEHIRNNQKHPRQPHKKTHKTENTLATT